MALARRFLHDSFGQRPSPNLVERQVPLLKEGVDIIGVAIPVQNVSDTLGRLKVGGELLVDEDYVENLEQ